MYLPLVVWWQRGKAGNPERVQLHATIGENLLSKRKHTRIEQQGCRRVRHHCILSESPVAFSPGPDRNPLAWVGATLGTTLGEFGIERWVQDVGPEPPDLLGRHDRG